MFHSANAVNRRGDRRAGVAIATRGLVAATFAVLALWTATPVVAHVSETGFVLLLPTEVYTTAGAAAVALTVLALAATPRRWSHAWSRPLVWGSRAWRRSEPGHATLDRTSGLEIAVSLLAFASMIALIALGLVGARDPLSNPLPLAVWTLFWIGLLTLQGVFGDLWRFLNPWTGPVAVLIGERAPVVRLPEWVGAWPGVAGLVIVAAFAFAHPAPDDPARLAVFVASYWALNFGCMILFGRAAWMAQGEGLSMMARLFAAMAPVRLSRGAVEIGLPGWRLSEWAAPSLSIGVFALVALGVGSFDGLNETFWWMALIGVNPLEFPGRSAIIVETVSGLLAANVLLVLVFAIAVWLGLALAGRDATLFSRAFARLALTVAPIALVYHFAHYLVAALINSQYALAAASDPLGVGADYLSLGVFYVTTGFLNTLATVEMIFQAQAGAVVLGHLVAVYLAHAVAVELFGDARRAALSQIPLALFMIAYTFLGLWLLASPKGA